MKILDGRDSFSQWDLNVKVTSNKFKVGDEIHFYNIRQPNALPVKAYLLDGKVVAEVPNILLQSAYPIFAYCMVDDVGATYTIKKYEFKVKQRPKPDDYVYTQTEVKTYDTLVERIDEMEKKGVSDERIGQAVSDYLEENPVNVDLTGYATEQFVKDGYQQKGDYLTEVPTGYATEEFVRRVIAEAAGSSATIGEVVLLSNAWVEVAEKHYAQRVNINGVTPRSQIDPTPTANQLAVFYNKEMMLVFENENGVVTAHLIGQKLENDYTIQVTITEVVV